MAVLDDPRQSQKRGRTRSPAYPYIALPNALEKAAVLWQVEGRHAAAVNVAMQHWGYKEDSSTGYSCVAALKKFGLVDHEGMGDARQVKLSDLALAILLDKNPDSDERREALRTAALGPRIHAELWERYGTELPSDPSLKRYLVLERGFNEAAVDELLEEYKQTMTFAGINVGTGAAAPGLAAALRQKGDADGSDTVTVTLTPAGPPRGQEAPPNGRLPHGARERALTIHPEPHDALALEAVSGAPTAPPRPQTGRGGSRQASPVARDVNDLIPGRLPESHRPQDLFGAGADTPPPVRTESSASAMSVRPDAFPRGTGPWSMARKELPVPLDNDLVARVPYPMSEEDFDLLIGTLQLWKKRLVQADL